MDRATPTCPTCGSDDRDIFLCSREPERRHAGALNASCLLKGCDCRDLWHFGFERQYRVVVKGPFRSMRAVASAEEGEAVIKSRMEESHPAHRPDAAWLEARLASPWERVEAGDAAST